MKKRLHVFLLICVLLVTVSCTRDGSFDISKLKYELTLTRGDGLVYDRYSDENGYYDVYNKTDLIGFESWKTDESKAEVVEKDKLVEIATDTLKSAIGKRFDGFEYTYTTDVSGIAYYVNFKTTYNGFITVDTAYVKLSPTGNVSKWHVFEHHYDDFDHALLDGITEKTVSDYLNSELKTDAPREIKEISLKRWKELYALQIDYSVQSGYSEDVSTDTIYYFLQ